MLNINNYGDAEDGVATSAAVTATSDAGGNDISISRISMAYNGA